MYIVAFFSYKNLHRTLSKQYTFDLSHNHSTVCADRFQSSMQMQTLQFYSIHLCNTAQTVRLDGESSLKFCIWLRSELWLCHSRQGTIEFHCCYLSTIEKGAHGKMENWSNIYQWLQVVLKAKGQLNELMVMLDYGYFGKSFWTVSDKKLKCCCTTSSRDNESQRQVGWKSVYIANWASILRACSAWCLKKLMYIQQIEDLLIGFQSTLK